MNELSVQRHSITSMDLDKVERFAKLMSTAHATIPEAFRNKPGDCLAVCLQAEAWGMNPFAVAQKTHLIKGKLGYEAQLVNAVISSNAALASRPVFTWSDGWERIIGKFKKMQGKNNGGEYLAPAWNEKDEAELWCEVSSLLKGESEPRVLRLYMTQAHPRQSTLWASDPKQQLAYSVIKRWARLHCPDVILGVYTTEELKAIPERDITPSPSEKLAMALQGEKVTVRTDTEQPRARPETDQYIEHKQSTQQISDITPADVVDVVEENKGEAMKQRVRENLREQGQVVDVGPSEQDLVNLDTAIQCLKLSQTLQELDEAGEAIKDVLHHDHKEQARKVYREMVKVLS